MQTTTPNTKPRQIIRRPSLRQQVPVSDMTINRWEEKGLFPKRIVLGPHSVGWFQDEVDAWKDARANQPGIASPNPRCAAEQREAR